MSPIRRAVLLLAPALIAAPALSDSPAVAEIHRMRSQFSTVLCAFDGPADLPEAMQATICRAQPAIPGPQHCPDAVDFLNFWVSYTGPVNRGRVRFVVERRGSDGTLLDKHSIRARLREGTTSTQIPGPGLLAPGESLTLTLELRQRKLRKLNVGQCLSFDSLARRSYVR